MQNSIIKIATFISILFLASCLKQSESIEPIAHVQTLAQMQREAMLATALSAGNSSLSEKTKATIEHNNDPEIFYLNLKYNIEEIDLYESADIPNSFEKLSNRFLRTLAKIFLKIKGSQTIEVDPVELALPDLNLDFEVVRSIRVKRVFLEYNKEFDESTGNKASFSFLGNLNLNRVGKDKSLLISYKKASNSCNFKCLDFKIDNGNVFDLLKNNSESIILKPTLSVVSIPKVTTLKLDGQIELQIGLKLPF